MAQLTVYGPLHERNLHHPLGPHPVGAEARQPRRPREWRARDLDRVELRAQLDQAPGVKAGADLASEDQLLALVVADEQRAEPLALTSWVRETADHEPLRGIALQ